MSPKIKKASVIGFCFGVRRALGIVEKAVREQGQVETLGAIVHNPPVLKRLAESGVRIASGPDDITGKVVVTSAHGISPQTEQAIRARNIDIIDTTCPFVQRAQTAARRLASAGYFVLIFGDAHHPEIQGILGWAGGNGLATLDDRALTELEPIPRRLAVLCQTTQIPGHFSEFAKQVIDQALTRDAEIRIVDTICHDIRKRQTAVRELARTVGLLLVIGGHESANTARLAQLGSAVTETYLVETAAEIRAAWLRGQPSVGIASGASTSEETINEVIARLNTLT